MRRDIKVGDQFGDLIVIDVGTKENPYRKKIGKDYKLAVLCVCSCNKNNKFLVGKSHLIEGLVKSCGCRNIVTLKKGEVYNNLELIENLGNDQTVGRGYKWLCRCTLCGSLKEAYAYDIKKGIVKDCGNHRKPKSKALHSYKEVKIGNKYGKLTVISEIFYKGNSKNKYVSCRCDCGNLKEVLVYSLLNGQTKSCGCSRYTSLVGHKINSLTVLAEVNPVIRKSGKLERRYMCRCDCGQLTEVRADRVKLGVIKSCGCSRLKSK